MEKTLLILIPVLLGYFLLRLLRKPLQLGLKLILHSAAGITCLTILNSVSHISGVLIPINPVTALTAAFLGLPGIVFLAALEIL